MLACIAPSAEAEDLSVIRDAPSGRRDKGEDQGCEAQRLTSGPVDLIEIRGSEGSTGGAEAAAFHTRFSLRSALQLAGCKTRLAHKATKAVFRELTGHDEDEAQPHDNRPASSGRTIVLEQQDLEDRIVQATTGLTENAPTRLDIRIACSIREQRSCVVILLAGTSGTGKSTLAGLLASRMGITTVVSTDSIRHMLRSFISEAEAPVLYTSTYQAGDVMLPLTGSPPSPGGQRHEPLVRTIRGYKAQCKLVMERIEQLVAGCEARGESAVVEGVHLSIGAVIRLLAAHPCVVPFLVHISNESKHQERFAVRAKYMTLDPEVNRYTKHIRQIRVIQDYLVSRARRYCVPAVDNTNVDRSVAAIHATVLSCLRRRQRGEEIFDRQSKTARPLVEDYDQWMRDAWSSKGMLQLIRSRKSAGKTASAATAAAAASDGLAGSAEEGSSHNRRAAAEALEAVAALDSSDRPPQQGYGSSMTEQRVEGDSIAETELEEAEEEAHSDTASGRAHSIEMPFRMLQTRMAAEGCSRS